MVEHTFQQLSSSLFTNHIPVLDLGSNNLIPIPPSSSLSSSSDQLKVHQCSHHHDWSSPINVLWLKSLTTEEDEDDDEHGGALGISYTTDKKELSCIQLELDVICYAPLDMSVYEAINKVRTLGNLLSLCTIREMKYVCVCECVFPSLFFLTTFLYIHPSTYSC